MFSDCPYCYRPIGTHHNDPILLQNGAPYDWISDTELVNIPDIEDRWFKGFYQISESDIIELQEELAELESDNNVTPLTEFSPVNSTGKFPITGKHIKEMRDSVEKILDAIGLTKMDYFNYDEEENHIIHPNGDKLDWTDSITDSTDLQKFQIKFIHIEELRHNISLLWRETWDTGYTLSKNLSIIDSSPLSFTEYASITEDEEWGATFRGIVQPTHSSIYDQNISLSANLTDSWIINFIVSAGTKSGEHPNPYYLPYATTYISFQTDINSFLLRKGTDENPKNLFIQLAYTTISSFTNSYIYKGIIGYQISIPSLENHFGYGGVLITCSAILSGIGSRTIKFFAGDTIAGVGYTGGLPANADYQVDLSDINIVDYFILKYGLTDEQVRLSTLENIMTTNYCVLSTGNYGIFQYNSGGFDFYKMYASNMTGNTNITIGDVNLKYKIT
jgi:hypothetical protein